MVRILFALFLKCNVSFLWIYQSDMKNSDNSADNPVGSSSATARAMRLLAALAAHGSSISLADLASATELPKPTAHRLCGQLLELGFVARDVDERYFAVGPALRQLAFDTLNHGSLSGLRHEVLADLAKKTGETCNFTTLDGASILYLDRVESKRPWRMTLDVGVHVPLHCTASGKVFLAEMTRNKRDYLLRQKPLEPLTPNTITTVEELRTDWKKALEDGYALDREEFIIGLIAIAIPVHDKSGELRAALAIHCPTTHCTVQDLLDKLPALQEARRRMTELL